MQSASTQLARSALFNAGRMLRSNTCERHRSDAAGCGFASKSRTNVLGARGVAPRDTFLIGDRGASSRHLQLADHFFPHEYFEHLVTFST
jgi:hypothetical protein